MVGVAVFCVQMTLTAWIDARTRRYPHWLWLCMLATSLWISVAGAGASVALMRVLLAAAVMLAFVVFELVWRLGHSGESGLGMGDIKCLGTLVIADPLRGLVSFFLGLMGLGLIGAALRVRSLPLLPFVVGAATLLFALPLFGMVPLQV